MFGLFKKKTEKEKLEDKYQKLLDQSYKLSHSNRAESDKLAAQAEEVRVKLEGME
ncbi:MAG: Lacal_2735 family protein [Flavobacteriia bacterium]|nr:Lacal_2735 family protein [Flavobacteriia bacterium]